MVDAHFVNGMGNVRVPAFHLPGKIGLSMRCFRHQVPTTSIKQACVPCSAIQRRTSSARHAVTRGDNFTGAGNVPASTRRHRVDFEMGTNVNTCGCRRKPVSGMCKLVERVVDMIKPSIGTCRMKKMTRSVAAMLGQVCMADRELKAR